jgi:hypothetical protein
MPSLPWRIARYCPLVEFAERPNKYLNCLVMRRAGRGGLLNGNSHLDQPRFSS